MIYKTVIEIVSEAEDRLDAVEIAGEFLRGNIESGVEIKCRTKPLKSRTLVKAGTLLILISILVFSGIASFKYSRATPVSFSRTDRISAFQPPLKTGQTALFQKAWREEENKKAVEYVKK